jgi:hypothetical protein
MKPLYEIDVHRMTVGSVAYEEGDHYGLSTNKKIGDYQGTGSPIKNKQELVESLKHALHGWKGHDYILDRVTDPPTKENTKIEIEKGLEKELISEQEIWAIIVQEKSGTRDLRSFFGGHD